MNKLLLSLFILLLLASITADAQIGIRVGPGFGYGMRAYPRYPRRNNQKRDSTDYSFKPSLNISLGYGFPDLDKNQFAGSYNYYPATVAATQSGPFIGSIDYQLNRTFAIGLLITHGTVTAPYYAYSTSSPSFTGSLENSAIMLDFVRYIPVPGKTVAPYIRTAIGINIWNENYIDAGGNKINYTSNPTDFAYQMSLGANFYIAKKAGLFIEAVYGKYILNGGLTFKL